MTRTVQIVAGYLLTLCIFAPGSATQRKILSDDGYSDGYDPFNAEFQVGVNGAPRLFGLAAEPEMGPPGRMFLKESQR